MFSLKGKIFLITIIVICCSLLSVPAINSKTNVVNSDFAFNIFKKMAGNSNANFNFAPLNLRLTLALAANGADGETRDEMIEVLDFKTQGLDNANKINRTILNIISQPLDDVKINLAQSMWIDDDLTVKEDFKHVNTKFYQSDLNYLDLSDPLAPDHINRWVYKNTEGKVFSMVDDVSEDVILFLLSSLYFKGDWSVQFKEENSKLLKFKTRDSIDREQIFMKTKSKKISWLQEKDFTAIGLPYGEGDVSMYFFLPDETSHIDFFIKNLNKKNWQKWMSEFGTQEVVAVVPRLELNGDITFNETLQDLGMNKAFSESAEFNNLFDDWAFVSEIKQKIFLSINEQGTEAAAADKVVFKKGGSKQLYLTRPFVYALVDNRTQAILILGVYQN